MKEISTPDNNIVASTEFLADLANARLPVAEATSLPAACYQAPEVQVAEQNEIFHRHWLGLGRADRFDKPGQYETMDIAGVPLLLLNDRHGKLHAFNNSCRHRGARLLDGQGSCKLVRCPFHCWTYDTEGQFVTAPHMQESKRFDQAEFGLHEFALKIHAGFIFVCFHHQPPSFSDHIGDFDTIHAPWPLHTLVSTRRISFEVNCNWKLFLDVFNEYYHLQYVHADSINSIYSKPDPADTTVGNYATQFGLNEGSSGLLEDQQHYALPKISGLEGRAKEGTRYTWVFPNMAFAAGNEAMWIYEAYPVDTQRCVAWQTLCFPKEAIEQADFSSKVEFYYQRFDAAVEEDRVALENQQRGLASPFAKPGPYSPLMEPSVAAFANWYAQQLAHE